MRAPNIISESLLGDGHKQVRGVNVRRYSKIRGPRRITIIINTPSVVAVLSLDHDGMKKNIYIPIYTG